jgi:hypothetical protein
MDDVLMRRLDLGALPPPPVTAPGSGPR